MSLFLVYFGIIAAAAFAGACGILLERLKARPRAGAAIKIKYGFLVAFCLGAAIALLLGAVLWPATFPAPSPQEYRKII